MRKWYIIQIINFLSAMVRILSFGERWNVPINEATPQNILTTARMKVLYDTEVLYDTATLFFVYHR